MGAALDTAGDATVLAKRFEMPIAALREAASCPELLLSTCRWLAQGSWSQG